MADERIRPQSRCYRYVPGHTPHHIQWNKARNDPATQSPGTVVAIDDRGIIVETGGETVTFQNHDLERVRELLEVCGPEIVVQTRWSLLWFDTYLVCVRRDDGTPLDACEIDGPPEGGFIARPGDDPDEVARKAYEAIMRAIERRDA